MQEEMKMEEVIPKTKYEIKCVYQHRFPSNIKSIEDLPMLKMLAVENLKNVFCIKRSYKTYVFTLDILHVENK
jgi:hypothetical protein